MVRFRRKLKGLPEASEDSLNQLSLQLSTACETELKESEDLLIEQHHQITDLVTATNRK